MSLERMDKQLARLNSLSERVFGDAVEIEPAEAEELLRAAGIEPARLKEALYQRMLERAEKYSRAGQELPPLFTQALEDLRIDLERNADETTLNRTARLTMGHLLREIADLAKLLSAGIPTLSFTAAYRNRTELSTRDKLILDGVAEDLRKKKHE